MRILPHQFIRAADARPFELHDLLPADTRFKLLVFAGDTSLPSQVVRLEEVAVKLEEGVLKKYGRGDGSGGGRVWSDGKGVGRDVFDVVVIGSAKKDKVNYTDIPEVLRSHWSKCVLPPLSPHYLLFTSLAMVGFVVGCCWMIRICLRGLEEGGMSGMGLIVRGGLLWLCVRMDMLG